MIGWLLSFANWIALASALLGLAAVLEARRFVRRRRDQLPPEFPAEFKAVIVVPCRGLVPGFRRNCQALLEQDHPNFELLFVVEDETDGAVGTIRNLMKEHRLTRIGLISAGPAEHCSQKVQQLRVALEHLPVNTRVVAFVDSDLLVRPQWLRWLCGRLYEPGIAAATGGVWSVPRKQSLWNNVQCSVSNSIATWFGPKRAPGIWGSWAVRLDRLEAAGVKQVWATAFSEAWSAHRALCLNGERVIFEPRSTGVRTVETNGAGLRRSLVRWFRSYQAAYPSQSWGFLVAGLLTQLGFWSLLLSGVANLGGGDGAGVWSLGAAALLYTLTVVTGMIRGQLGKLFADDSRFNRAARRWDCWGWPINSGLIVLADVLARLGRRVRWLDLVYLVDASGRVSLLGRKRLRPLEDELAAEYGERGRTIVRQVVAAPPHGEPVPEPVSARAEGGVAKRAA